MRRASDGQPDRRPEVYEHVLAELDLLLEDNGLWLSGAARTGLRAPVRTVPIGRCARSYVKVSPFHNYLRAVVLTDRIAVQILNEPK